VKELLIKLKTTMKNFNAVEWIALALLLVGGINWGLIGAFNIDLVSSLFGEATILTRGIYGLVGLSALMVAFSAFTSTYDAPTTNNRAYQS
jgi:hypothetical protein